MEINQQKTVKSRFRTVTEEEKHTIYSKRKAQNTNNATKLWINCLKDYLIEKNFPDLEDLDNTQLTDVLCNFYVEARRKKKDDTEQYFAVDNDADDVSLSYKTTTLHAIRGAFTRYFKETRNIDIRTSPIFIRSNEMFLGKTKENKEKGLGKIDNKPPITDEDMKKIGDYFRKTMLGWPNAKGLQQIMLFNIIYYLCRRGRENLRKMTKSTFAIATDPTNGKEYIYQNEDEADKNHSVGDTDIANQGRIYSKEGTRS